MSNTPKNQVVEKIRGLLEGGQDIFRKRTVSLLLLAYDTQAALLEENRYQNAKLRKALEFYAEDDARAVEMGILESVDDRPAKGALK